ncbi:DoxX family protein [Alteribacter populi]|uniref:DoxX family protein n=1 Tax=Alteribacter populi TaxID=2011011 RepID=UPI000BBB59AC|nr:DoxX family protein [Alteribacter populi]
MVNNEIGAFILRLTLGAIFLAHGASKFQGGIENTAAWFDSIGIPGFMAYVVASVEVVGGLALIIGIGTRIASMIFAVLMIGAIFTVQLPNGFLDGYAFDLALLSISAYLLLNGSKLYSVGHLIFKSQENNNNYTKLG